MSRVDIECAHCDRPFSVKASKAEARRYCSDDCAHAAQRRDVSFSGDARLLAALSHLESRIAAAARRRARAWRMPSGAEQDLAQEGRFAAWQRLERLGGSWDLDSAWGIVRKAVLGAMVEFFAVHRDAVSRPVNDASASRRSQEGLCGRALSDDGDEAALDEVPADCPDLVDEIADARDRVTFEMALEWLRPAERAVLCGRREGVPHEAIGRAIGTGRTNVIRLEKQAIQRVITWVSESRVELDVAC